MYGFRKRVLCSLLCTGSGQVVRQTLILVVGIILARALRPEEYGLFAMVAVLTGLAELFLDLGFGAAIVQRKDLTEEHLSSIFWLTVLLGVALSAAGTAAAPLVAGFYGKPILLPLTILLSLNFAIGSLKVVQFALLNRQMNFRRLVVIETVAILGAGSTAILMALHGFGVWSLATQVLLFNCLTVVPIWCTSSWRPRLTFRLSAIRDVLGFSGNLLGYQITNYWSMRIDHLLIGRVIGAASLGIYSKAYELMMFPLRQVHFVGSRVMFPALSSIQGDHQRMKQIYLKSVGCIALICFPLILGIGAVADSMIPAVLGPQWVDVTPVLRVFCIVGVVHSIGSTTGWIFMARGRTDLMLRWGMFAAVVKTIAIIIGLRWGAIGVAVAYTVSVYVFLVYPAFAIPGRLIGVSFMEIVRVVRAPLVCAVVMAGGVLALRTAMPQGLSEWVYLAAQVPAGIAIYWLPAHAFRIKPYKDLWHIVLEQMATRHAQQPQIA